MPHHLFIVSGRAPELYTYLQTRFESDDRVRVILDRRHCQRRQRSGPTISSERRGADRRIREDVQRELETRLYVNVTVP